MNYNEIVNSDHYRAIRKRARIRPSWYIEEVLGERPWRTDRFDARDIIDSVFFNRITCVQSCHGVSKSWSAARIAQAFFDIYPNECRVFTTAPTKRQVQEILWAEIPRANQKANAALGWDDSTNIFDITRHELWKMKGFTATKNNENAFHGLHTLNQLVILDEAAGIDPVIFLGALAVSTAENNRILMVGNPTDPTSKFADYCKRKDVMTFKISAWDTPNFREFGIERQHIASGEWRKMITGPLPAPYLITPEWVDGMWKECRSFDHPWWMARVEGEFPTQHEKQLIPLDWIEKARNRTIEPDPDDWRAFGLDIGETGPDEAPCADNFGGRVRWAFILSRNLADGLWNRAARAYQETHPHPSIINCDATGGGLGVDRRLLEMGIPAARLVMSERSSQPGLYLNLRAELYFHMRQVFNPDDDEFGHIDIPEVDDVLAAQFAGLRFDVKDNKYKMESKEEARKRGIKSPDRADAVMLSCSPLRDSAMDGTCW